MKYNPQAKRGQAARGLASFALLVCVMVSASTLSAETYQAEVEDASDRAYFEEAKTLIDQAKQSISLSLYALDIKEGDLNHPGTRLAQSLIQASRRGVSIDAVLNRNYEFDLPGKESIFTRNDNAFAYLRQAGIAGVSFADPGRRVHDKLLVVDGEWVLEGSHNWSYSAIRLNRESSTLIHSAEYAKLKAARIRAIKRLPEDQPLQGKSIQIPNAFLKEPRFLKRFVGKHDFRALQVYLWLIYESDRQSSRELELDFETLARWTNLPADWDQNKKRRQLIKILKKKLAGRYGLIKAEIPHGGNAQIRMLKIESAETGWINLPAALFDYGMIQPLSEAGIAVYLTALYLAETSPIAPSWAVPQTAWANLFGISKSVIHSGTWELRQANLIEVIYFGQDQKPFFKDRPVSQYRLNLLLPPETIQRQWKTLQEKSTPDDYARTGKMAQDLEDPNDPLLREQLLKLLENYPDEWIEESMNRLRGLRTDNPRKNFYYLEGILEGFASDR